VEDTPESSVTSILHALANALNGILITVQLQQRYLSENPERMRQLITDTTKDLKNELDHLQRLVENLRQVLKG
jgi:signal transduction histidine kinase